MRILAAVLSLACCQAGVITGRVVITRQITKKVVVPVYQFRGPAMDRAPEPPGDELQRIVVFVTGGDLPPGQPVHESIHQRGQRFDPELVVAPAGSTISFPNDDPIFHNVFSLSKAKSFDLGYYPKGHSKDVVFRQPGIVQIYCHIHADMSAAIVVTPSSAFARPGPGGSFRIPDLPPGDYELIAWHASAGIFRRAVHVGAAPVPIEFLIPVRDGGR